MVVYVKQAEILTGDSGVARMSLQQMQPRGPSAFLHITDGKAHDVNVLDQPFRPSTRTPILPKTSTN